MDYTIKVSQYSPPQVYVFDESRYVTNSDYIAHTVLVLQDNEQPGNQIFYQTLSTETDSNASYASTGQDRRNGYLQFREHHKDRDKKHDHLPRTSKDPRQCISPLSDLLLGFASTASQSYSN